MTACTHTTRGWPDPTELGVPAAALHDGYHWLVNPAPGGAATIGQWSPDSWSWKLSYVPYRQCPKDMSHMNYLGPIRPPIILD
jgi:hypothetical protein